MATGVNTQYNIGIRHNIKLPSGTVLGERNFEPALATANPATVQYQSRLNNLWWIDGSHINLGSVIPYDVGGNRYSTAAKSLLAKYWDDRFIDPTT